MWHAVPRCHFTGANVCAAWFQTGVSFRAVLLMALCSSTSVCDISPTSKALYSLLSTDVKPVGFLLLGNLNTVLSLMHLWNTAMDVAEVWTVYRCLRLGQSQCFWSVYFDSWVQKQCVENRTGSGIKLVLLYWVWKSLCYWDIDAAVEMKRVEMQKLPCLENKTSHEMERNKMKNWSIPCLKEVGKDFAGELSLSCP